MRKALFFFILFLSGFVPLCLYAQNQGLDPSFGNNGIVLKIGPNHQSGNGGFGSIIILSDGRLLVIGDSLRRYHIDGSLDNSFGYNGADKYYYGPYMLLQPDGRILTAGGSYYNALHGGVSRNLPDGGMDNSFGTNGKVAADDSTDIKGVLLQPDGKIILFGGNNQKDYMALFRYLPDGRPDSSFGGNGRVFRYFEYPMLGIYPRGGGLMADGRIVIGGDFGTAFGADSFFAMRFMPDGTSDTSFNHRGTATIPYLHPCTDVAVQPDGKILLAGYQNLGAPNNVPFLLARLNKNGSIDAGFADGGVAAYEWGTGAENKARVMKLQPDGRILLGGRAWDNELQKYNFAMVRFLPDGHPDSSFGDNGALQTRIRNNDDDILGLAFQTDGKIIATGTTERPACNGCNDGAMVRYLPDGQTGIPGILPSPSDIGLYPNPASETLHISYPAGMEVQSLILYNAAGQLLMQSAAALKQINVKGFAIGSYVLGFGCKDGAVVYKGFVIRR